MSIRWTAAGALATLALLTLAPLAHARNPHCAGGIQYVVQAMRDKEKGNIDDYQREINKAVQQLQQCAAEDPVDLEALGYLGWALAEVDSAGPAGEAFQAAIDGLKSKGDPKKSEWASTNRRSYWANAFNDGISKINQAQSLWPDYSHKPENEADKAAFDEATKKYQEALASLTRASLLLPGDPNTIRNQGAIYAFTGQFDKAAAVFEAGLKVAPRDSSLVDALKAARINHAGHLIDQKKYDEAIGYYTDLLKADAGNSDLYLGLADAHFKRAQGVKGEPARPDYKAAGDAYAKAGTLKSGDADLPFNGALAYQNAGEWALAEGQWKASLKVRPADVDAISALGASLSELKKFDEAVQVLHDGVMANPKNKVMHRQLGAVYTRLGNNARSTEELMVFLALQAGKPVDDPAARAKTAPAGSAAAKTLASLGVPEQIIPWEADQQKIESWFYWSKNQAYHFQGGNLYVKSDWNSMDAKSVSAPSTDKK